MSKQHTVPEMELENSLFLTSLVELTTEAILMLFCFEEKFLTIILIFHFHLARLIFFSEFKSYIFAVVWLSTALQGPCFGGLVPGK
jgi:hypothetical protein